MNRTDFLGLADCKPDCEKLRQLLAGDRANLRNAIQNQLTGIDDRMKAQLAEDIERIGLSGGNLGQAMMHRILMGGLEAENAKGVEPGSAALSGKIRLDFSEPLYYYRLKPVIEDLRRGGFTRAEALQYENNTAWRRETVVGHELGHGLIGTGDPTNVVVVQNRLAKSFIANGLEEIVADNYNSKPLFPKYLGDGEWWIPGRLSGYLPGTDIPIYKDRSFEEFWKDASVVSLKMLDTKGAVRTLPAWADRFDLWN